MSRAGQLARLLRLKQARGHPCAPGSVCAGVCVLCDSTYASCVSVCAQALPAASATHSSSAATRACGHLALPGAGPQGAAAGGGWLLRGFFTSQRAYAANGRRAGARPSQTPPARPVAAPSSPAAAPPKALSPFQRWLQNFQAAPAVTKVGALAPTWREAMHACAGACVALVKGAPPQTLCAVGARLLAPAGPGLCGRHTLLGTGAPRVQAPVHAAAA